MFNPIYIIPIVTAYNAVILCINKVIDTPVIKVITDLISNFSL